MSYVFEKQYTDMFEIEKIKVNFMKYCSFSNVRKDIPNCELCRKEFQAEDNTNLAFIKNKKNHLICDDCTYKSIEGGAEKIDW